VHEGTVALSAPYNPPGGGFSGPGGGGQGFTFTNSPMLDAIITTCIGLGAVFVGGIVYMKWYKQNVLNKIEDAFKPGYDPALELAKSQVHLRASGDDADEPFSDTAESWTEDLRREEQDFIDDIVHGEETGHYYMLLGPKGSGKGTMIFEAMAAIQADGVSMCDAHPDLEVFRLRLGKALNYEYNEDTQTGLFQRRDPREGGAPLDIERAMNKLEKVALKCAKDRGKPLVLIINNIHFFQNDEEGRNVILQLQQKAEAWAASGVLTVIFNSDDFWPFHVMRKHASRMQVVNIGDLSFGDSIQAAQRIRHRVSRPPAGADEFKEAIKYVGGRLSFIIKVARARDMVSAARHLLEIEKGWLLSRIGLIEDCDDDVMDEQKWSSCSWLLLEAFVKQYRESERERAEAIERGETTEEEAGELPLPTISYYRCRQIMTRADFMEDLDRANIIAVDVEHNVRPDSMLILRAAMEMVEEDRFDEMLESVRDRIDAIESLHRTRELTFKDMEKGDVIRLSVDKGGAAMWLRSNHELGRKDDDDDDDD